METLAWPAVVMIIVLFGIVAFRKPITKLLDKTNRIEIGRGGVKTYGDTGQKAADAKPTAVDELLSAFDNVLLKEQEKLIRKDLAGKDLTDSDTVKVLIRHLAATQISAAFERIDTLIWGSQLTLLEMLNSAVQLSGSQAVARILYAKAAQEYPDTYREYAFDRWLGFVKSLGVISEKDNQLSITNLGAQFLAYLTEQGRTRKGRLL